MKKLFFLACILLSGFMASAQNTKKPMSLAAGREILRMLPSQISSLKAEERKDRVYDRKGKQGVGLRRLYGKENNPIYIELIDQSLSYNIITAAIAKATQSPTPAYQVADINGYKSLVQRVHSEKGKTQFEIVIPIENTLLLLRAPSYDRNDLVLLAKTLPLDKIQKRLQ